MDAAATGPTKTTSRASWSSNVQDGQQRAFSRHDWQHKFRLGIGAEGKRENGVVGCTGCK
jgi:hypothetical protein